MKTMLTTGAAMRLHLTVAEIQELPGALHEAAMGTYRPAVPHDTAEKNALWGPLIDQAGELGQVWRIAHRGLTILAAITPDGQRTSWAMLDETGATLETRHHTGAMKLRDAQDRIDEELLWRRVTAPDTSQREAS
jgi:hypothetical protein